VSGGVIGSEGQSGHEQAANEHLLAGCCCCNQESQQQQRNLTNEHGLAAHAISQATEEQGSEQNSSQGGGGNQAFVNVSEGKVFTDQRQANALHEDNHALKELASSGKPPHKPLC
jgi:hypothetical protein